MAEVAAGKDVLSYCNKCKLTLSHTIVVMKDAKTIGKVQCNTCKSVHAYKMASNAPTRKPTAKKTASGRSRRPSAAEVPLSQVWEETLERSKATKKTYSPKACFVIGDPAPAPQRIQSTTSSRKPPHRVKLESQADLRKYINQQ